jgi:hypothetical protein
MSYVINRINFGTDKRNKITDINTDFFISDFRYIEKFGFLLCFPKDNCIGYIDLNNKVKIPWVSNLKEPYSICNSKYSFYIMEDQGERIQQLDISSGYVHSVFGKSIEKDISKYFSKIKDVKDYRVSCDVGNNGTIYWCNNLLNRCFKFGSPDFRNYIGSGKRGYAVSNDLNYVLLNDPSGLCWENNSLYISDAGNSCIRKCDGKSIQTIIGNPNKCGNNDGKGLDCLLNRPSKIKGNKGVFYFIDNLFIKIFSLSDLYCRTIYESPNVVSVDIVNRDLFILEKI